LRIHNGRSNMKNISKSREHTGFTLIELLVVISIIALLMAVLMPALSKARKQGKRAACMSNIKQLLLGWTAYGETYEGKIANGGQASLDRPITEDYWCTSAKPADLKYDWDWFPWDITTLQKRIDKLKTGSLWPYLKNPDIYRCPESKRNMHRTYSIVTSMNARWDFVAKCCDSKEGEINYSLGQIQKPQEKIVFVEEGFPSPNAFEVYYVKESWCDKPQAPHNKAANFGYSDGHVELWKYEDKRTMCWATIDWSNPQDPPGCSGDQPGNKDMQKFKIATWGKLGKNPPSPTPPGVNIP
jgi:prepilin-type N-terminal cleavage/methylation domain-containing protein/prepilin-type processing-associated H-X9-DG protein